MIGALILAATVSGTVCYRGHPMPHAVVTMSSYELSGTRTGLTNDRGEFALTGMPPAAYVIFVEWLEMEAAYAPPQVVCTRGREHDVHVAFEVLDGEEPPADRHATLMRATANCPSLTLREEINNRPERQ